MERQKFEAVDPLVEMIADVLDTFFASEAALPLKKRIAEISALVSPGYSVSLDSRVTIFDPERECALPLLTTGLCSSEGDDPYRTYGDCSPHRYVVRGEMMTVPHDHCPACWGEWDFKFDHPTCDECGVQLGKEIKIMLDSDVCPHCEKGQVNATQLTCQRCGYSIDPHYVVWG